MKPMVFVLVPFALIGLATATARADDARSRSIAPFLDNDVFAIGRLDLAKVDVDKLAHRLVADQEQAGEMAQISRRGSRPCATRVPRNCTCWESCPSS